MEEIILAKVRQSFEEHQPIRFLIEIPTEDLPAKNVWDTWASIRQDVQAALDRGGLEDVLEKEREDAEEADMATNNQKGKGRATEEEQSKPKPVTTIVRMAWMEIFSDNTYMLVEFNDREYDFATADERDTSMIPVYMLRRVKPKQPGKSDAEGGSSSSSSSSATEQNKKDADDDDGDKGPFAIINVQPGTAKRISHRSEEVHLHYQIMMGLAMKDGGEDKESLKRFRPPFVIDHSDGDEGDYPADNTPVIE
ncbi:hypothetical protein VTN77DRAFT_5236 [Rasamsonia byssochlamydoides]|uniref:uncharacterized protein n=1 Tax=Rasamsonia byssochlamydoides TaxID=89139 RepID=UPI00374414D8